MSAIGSGGRRRRESLRRWVIDAVLRLALWAALALPAAGARAVIDVGETAPAFQLEDVRGRAHALDGQSSVPLVLVFAMPEDLYTSRALADLDAMFARDRALGVGLRRWVIFSRIRSGDTLARIQAVAKAHPAWTVLLDRRDAPYRDYWIVATPTVVLVGPDHKVAATHPGYDPALEQDVRLALARLLGVTLPEAATGTPAPPDMRLQMARRLAERGLYDRALPFYLKIAESGPLPPEAQLELAEVYLGLARLDEARALLDQAPKEGPLAARAAQIAARVRAIKQGLPDPGRPSKAHIPQNITSPTNRIQGP